MVGRSAGSVMCHVRCQRFAPSLAAFSYSSGFMFARTAR